MPRQTISRGVPLVLVCCTWVSILSTSLYTPSLPHLPEVLHTSVSTVQLTMSLNLAAYAVAQLVHGPLSDRFGRRRLLLIGLWAFVVASLLCAFATTIELLLIGRVAQGLSVSVASVVVMLLIRELYGPGRAVRIMGLYGIALGVMPILGPIVGGHLYVAFGWQSNFVLLAGLGLAVAVLVWRLVPESKPPEPGALRPALVLARYGHLLSNRNYLRQLIPLALVFGSLFAFATDGPFLLIERHGVATEAYGYYYACLVVAYMAGSLTASRLGGRLPTERLSAASVPMALGGSLIVLLPLLAGQDSLLTLLAGVAVVGFAVGLLLPTGSVAMLDAASGETRGLASALTGSMQLAIASLAGLAVGALHDGTAWPVAWVLLVFNGLAFMSYLIFPRRRRP